MKLPENILDLVTDYISNEISNDGKQELSNWINKSEANKKEIKKYFNLKYRAEIGYKYSQILVEQNWEKQKQKLKKKQFKLKLIRYSSTVAAACFLIALITFSLKNNYNSSRHTTFKTINHADAKIILRRHNGNIIELGKQKKMIVLKDTNEIIAKGLGKGLNYKEAENKTFDKLVFDQIEVPVSGEYFFVLSDGTKVWLNSKTKLKYPVKFVGKTRTVYLQGEAYFEVAHNKEKPFYVFTTHSTTKVLGTSFNISAYNEDMFTNIGLAEGSVEVELKNSRKELLTPGFQLEFNNKSHKYIKEKKDIADIAAWKDGIFSFNNMRLEDISLRLERWYNVGFTFEEEIIKDLPFTGKIKKNISIEKILNAISKTTMIKYKKYDNKIYVYR